MTEGARAVRIQLLIGFMCVALVIYFLLLGRIAMAFITSGSAAAIGLGLALPFLLLTLAPAWRRLLPAPGPWMTRVQQLLAFPLYASVAWLVWVLGAQVGNAAAIGLGLALLIMPLIGIWVMVSTLQAGFAHQRLARIIRDEGMELDVAGLPRTPSGRIQRDAADALFETVRDELEKDPDNWRRWYRLARAYDYAGDRSRAREAMKKALEMERALQENE